MFFFSNVSLGCLGQEYKIWVSLRVVTDEGFCRGLRSTRRVLFPLLCESIQKLLRASRTCAFTISPFSTMGGTPRNVFSMSMKWNERIECHSPKSVLSLSMILSMWVTNRTRLGLSCCHLKCVRFCSFFCSLRFSAKGVFCFAQSSSRVKSKKCVFWTDSHFCKGFWIPL